MQPRLRPTPDLRDIRRAENIHCINGMAKKEKKIYFEVHCVCPQTLLFLEGVASCRIDPSPSTPQQYIVASTSIDCYLLLIIIVVERDRSSLSSRFRLAGERAPQLRSPTSILFLRHLS